jgi:hypothetical protein
MVSSLHPFLFVLVSTMTPKYVLSNPCFLLHHHKQSLIGKLFLISLFFFLPIPGYAFGLSNARVFCNDEHAPNAL